MGACGRELPKCLVAPTSGAAIQLFDDACGDSAELLLLILGTHRLHIVVPFWDYLITYEILNVDHEKELLWSLWVSSSMAHDNS